MYKKSKIMLIMNAFIYFNKKTMRNFPKRQNVLIWLYIKILSTGESLELGGGPKRDKSQNNMFKGVTWRASIR